MTSPTPPDPERPARVSLALPDGELRRRVLEVLEGTDVEIEILDGDNLLEEVQQADADMVLVDAEQAQEADLDVLGEASRDEAGAGVAVIGEDDPGTRARLLAAGLSGVVGSGQRDDALESTLVSLVDAEVAGSHGGPQVGGAEVRPRLTDFLTRSATMREFVELVRRVVDADTSLLITGPTGVGKEHLARAIHAEGPRSEAAFVDVNCAALPEQLLEAELFGHEKGAFTGAVRERRGHFQRADGGTLFLDEIGEMPMHLQVKLLTALQRHEVTPVGADASLRVNVRVIAATNRDLAQDVADGRFREDLFYRLNVVPLQIPALRERPEDVPELVGRCIQHFRGVMPSSSVERISDAAVEAMMGYPWPGNVRELINVVERGMLLAQGEEIGVEDLAPELLQGESGATTEPSGSGGSPGLAAGDWEGKTLKEVREAAVANAERAFLVHLLKRHQGQVGATAEAAGLSARALYAKMKRYGLKKESFR